MAVAMGLLPLSVVRSLDGGSRGLGVEEASRLLLFQEEPQPLLPNSLRCSWSTFGCFLYPASPPSFWGPLAIPLWQPLTLTGVPMKLLMVVVWHTIFSAPTLLSFWMSGHLLAGFPALLGSLSNGVS